MGAGSLRRHRAMLDAAVGPASPQTREQTLQEQLDAERARSADLQQQLEARGAGEPSEELLAKFDEELQRRTEALSKAVDEHRAEAGAEIEKLKASADEISAKLAAAEEELASLRAAAPAPAAPADAPPAASAPAAETAPEPQRGSRRR